jgi:AraC family L-rhamnose operon regulatory protein RhaS
MPKPIPIYKDHDETYRADTCAPVVRAAEAGQLRLTSLVHGHYPGRKLPADALPGIKTVGFWDAEHDQDWGLPWHRNEGLELTFLESGTLGFAVEGRECVLHPDDLTVTRPWQQHRVGLPNVTRGRLYALIVDVGVRRPNQPWKWPGWLVLSRPDLAELTNVLRHNEQPVWSGPAALRRCFQAIGHAVESDRNGSSVSQLAVRLNDLFLELLEMFRQRKVRLDRSLSSSRRAVELFLGDARAHPEHFEEESTVDSMASACGLGTTQFIHYVKRLTNMTPVQYLNECRLEAAQRMLREAPEQGITQVALACGFNSSQYFARLFRRRFGCSPHEIRTAPGQRRSSCSG